MLLLLLLLLKAVAAVCTCIITQGVTATTQRQRITSREMSSDECDSLQCEHARFGFALTNIGDLDRDGYSGQ